MMSGSELWSENEVLRQKLLETQRLLERERELRQGLQAENLWLKQVLEKRASENETAEFAFADSAASS